MAPPDSSSTGSQEQRDADDGQNSAPKATETVDENHNQAQLLVAGLHRDGEQARIVEVIRRRQQKCDEKYYTFEYIWESVLYFSGFADEHPSSTQQLNDTQIDNGG